MRGLSIIIRLLRMLLGLRRQDLSLLSSELEIEEAPRSLNGCDSLLLPQIQKDFPDFDVSLAKTYVRDHLKEMLSDRSGLTVHNVVISRYLRSGAQKCIVFQAALSYQDNGRKVQKRYELNYTYLLPSGTTAANCPNCGGALGFGQRECAYCGSAVANALANNWTFTEVRES